MKLIAFNLSKIHAEKKGIIPSKGLEVNSNIDISSVNKTNVDLLKTQEDFLEVFFTYSLDYSENYAAIEFSGKILLSVEHKHAKEILHDWKDKKISEEFRLILLNIIIQRTSIKSLELEETLNIPLHLPLPKVTQKKEDSS